MGAGPDQIVMKAVVNTRYGSPEVLELQELPRPNPKRGEVRIKVHVTTVTRSDCGMLRARPLAVRLFTGPLRPRNTILGMDFAGEVDEVGPDVASLRPGDRVFGMSPDTYGAHAEYLCIAAQGTLAAMPSALRFDEAVVCEGAWYADMYMRRFGVGPAHRLLIYGASGAIGTAAVQLAKCYGAEVTAVVATRHLQLMQALGADHVVDFTAGDFTRIGQRFDFVLDAVGKTTYFRCRKLLEPHGTFAGTDLGPGWQNPLLAIGSAITHSNRVVFPLPKSSRAFVEFLKARMEAHEFRAVVDRRYSLDSIADAYRYVETGQKTGIVVVDVAAGGGRSVAGGVSRDVRPAVNAVHDH